MNISVIIPVFNTAEYLHESLSSILSQDVDGLEVICVDDGSTDNSHLVLESYANRDNRLRVIRQKNSGQGASRNRGVEMAKGRYILFFDSDDILFPDALRMLLGEVSDADLIGFDHTTFHGTCPRQHTVPHKASPVNKEILLRKMGVVWNKMFRRDWWTANSLKFPEGVIYEDIPVHWKMILLASKSLYLPVTLHGLRIRSSSTTLSYAKSMKRLDSVSAFDEVRGFLESHPSRNAYFDLFKELEWRNLSTCISSLWHLGPAARSRLGMLVSERLADEDFNIAAWKRLSFRERTTLLAARGHFISSVLLVLALRLRTALHFFKSLNQ